MSIFAYTLSAVERCQALKLDLVAINTEPAGCTQLRVSMMEEALEQETRTGYWSYILLLLLFKENIKYMI